VSWGLTLKRKDENEKGRAPFSVKEEEDETKKKKKKSFLGFSQIYKDLSPQPQI